MKLSQKITLSLAIMTVAGIALCFASTRSKCDSKKMLTQIADEGYETANDVLFPGKNLQAKNLKYGPVLPS